MIKVCSRGSVPVFDMVWSYDRCSPLRAAARCPWVPTSHSSQRFAAPASEISPAHGTSYQGCHLATKDS